jgi:hypothetical protein
VATQQAKRENTDEPAPSSSPANIQTATLTPPSEPAPARVSPLAGGGLVVEIKKELKRVGCYDGRIDEKWPTKEMRASVQKLANLTRITMHPPNPVWRFWMQLAES